MTLTFVRRAATSMVLATVAATWLMASLTTSDVSASECCQTCEAKDTSCQNNCNSLSHDGGGDDSLEACLAACEHELYERPGACYLNCSYCTPPAPYCVALAVTHFCWQRDDNGYCLRWGHDLTPVGC